MRDFWFAECLPCKWERKCETQDVAIRAAEDHVFIKHRDVPSAVRADLKMGHVQNRTENAVATERPAAELGPGDTVEVTAYRVYDTQALSPAPETTE